MLEYLWWSVVYGGLWIIEVRPGPHCCRFLRRREWGSMNRAGFLERLCRSTLRPAHNGLGLLCNRFIRRLENR